jgi:hypothetical protein
MPGQVFISHSSADKLWVEWIARCADHMGVTPYLAEHDPQPGTKLSDKVKRAIVESDAVIALLTEQAMSSVYVQQEIGIATQAERLIIPIVHPAVEGRSKGVLDGLECILFDFDNPQETTSHVLVQLQGIGERAARRELKTRTDAARKKQQEDMFRAVLVAGVVVALVYAASQG